jgi:hypothetical protein
VTTAGSRPRSRDGLLWSLLVTECVLGELIYVGLIGQRVGFAVAACTAGLNLCLLVPALLRRWADGSAVVVLLALPIMIWAIAHGGAARTWIAGLPAVVVLSLVFRLVESRSGAAGGRPGLQPRR